MKVKVREWINLSSETKQYLLVKISVVQNNK